VADVGYIAIVVAGFGAFWWRHMRLARSRGSASAYFTPEAEVALHVAGHEARARRQDLSSLHVLYGLLQDEAVSEAIATAGGDAAALEDRVLAALSTPAEDARDDGQWLLGRAVAVARHADRLASCTDLWAYLGNSYAGRLVDQSQLDRAATLFALFHGGREPEIPLGDERDVFVVLRNDHYTTQEFVCAMLRDVFALDDAGAHAIMLTTHTTGRAVIGRFSAGAAREKIARVRGLAHAQHFPLWIGIEPA
jgi:ATP-dependent Clp protease adapter protein ClpS